MEWGREGEMNDMIGGSETQMQMHWGDGVAWLSSAKPNEVGPKSQAISPSKL